MTQTSEVDAKPGSLRDVSLPVGSSGKGPVRSLGGLCPQKLKHFVRFLMKLLTIRAISIGFIFDFIMLIIPFAKHVDLSKMYH